jgi:hypothetical protein
MTQTYKFQCSVLDNSLHACALPGCSKPRHGVERWCKDHTLRSRRHGHPNARALASKLWSTERDLVADLLSKNVRHRGQLQAIDWLAGLIAQSVANERSFKGSEELARLARHGVTPQSILIELAAVHLYLTANPRAVPDDRAWDFAVSGAVTRLAPRPRRSTRKPGTPWPVTAKARTNFTYSPKARPSALAFLGRHLRQSLAPFLANVQSAIETREQQQRSFEAELSAPLSAI